VAVDVAAGTGKLSRQLLGAGARCVAVDPSASMRAECVLASPGVSVVGGAAECLPLRRGCADLLTVAQGFHWFEADAALHEMARVLRPEGALILVWNERDRSVPWAAALDQVLRRAAQGTAFTVTEIMDPTFDGDPHFSAFTMWQGQHEVTMVPAQVVDMVTSRSYMQVMGEAAQRQVVDEVRAIVDPLGPTLVMPYTTTAYCATARPGGCACDEEV
jgi:ubiquinone/menaquinone biosynthesis C-methylase UbiE